MFSLRYTWFWRPVPSGLLNEAQEVYTYNQPLCGLTLPSAKMCSCWPGIGNAIGSQTWLSERVKEVDMTINELGLSYSACIFIKLPDVLLSQLIAIKCYTISLVKLRLNTNLTHLKVLSHFVWNYVF